MKVTIKLKCIQCGHRDVINPGVAPPGELPHCPKCGNIMLATKAEITHPKGEPETEKSSCPSPFVMCGGHKLRRGYIMCVHVAAGVNPGWVRLSRGKHPGEIVCTNEIHHEVEQFILICEGCVIERGWIKAADCEKRDQREKLKRKKQPV